MTSIKRFSALQRAENSSIDPSHERSSPNGGFQCSSASRKFLNNRRTSTDTRPDQFQCSSASRKFLNRRRLGQRRCDLHVSVLFSEPKIPQLRNLERRCTSIARFSALQRAENSSIASAPGGRAGLAVSVLFSEPKIPQCEIIQLAELGREFQCSSASRKFLNSSTLRPAFSIRLCFSALQRAENSSIRKPMSFISALFQVSVLFSEPKIPQSRESAALASLWKGFQCSSASRKFLNSRRTRCWRRWTRFQCSSASRKFLNMAN